MLAHLKQGLKGVIFDWAGTVVDFGCMAPLAVFYEIFKSKNILLSYDEIRKPMGLMKMDHIRELCKLHRIEAEWKKLQNDAPSEADIEDLFHQFEPSLLKILPNHCDIIPGTLETVKELRKMNMKIGSTTGYVHKMMDVLVPIVAKNGYRPDSIVNSSQVRKGRPEPWMAFKNAKNLNVFPMDLFVKVGDTVADIQEGINANMWSVGVIEGSSVLGLQKNEFDSMDKSILCKKIKEARQVFLNAGADYAIDSIRELPEFIMKINERMKNGERPGNFTHIPEQPYVLFTPGPITTSKTVKLSMMTDWGSRETDYLELVEEVRKEIVKIATSQTMDYTTVIMQGSGTFAVESAVCSSIPKSGKFLVIINGSYGKRMSIMAKKHNISTIDLEFEETDIPDVNQIEKVLQDNPDITHVGVIHSETTTGILNPIESIAKIVKQYKKILLVDAMSSFGSIPMDIGELGIDFMISSANKNVQGVPGFAFIIAKTSELKKCKDISPSLSLDMHDQWSYLEKTKGGFRYTSPVHVIRAFRQALKELEAEGGVVARFKRQDEMQKLLVSGMIEMGFEPLDLKGYQGPIITSFLNPKSEKQNFEKFQNDLKKKGLVIYPGKLTKADTFRIGTIGHLFKEDVLKLLKGIKDVKTW